MRVSQMMKSWFRPLSQMRTAGVALSLFVAMFVVGVGCSSDDDGNIRYTDGGGDAGDASDGSAADTSGGSADASSGTSGEEGLGSGEGSGGEGNSGGNNEPVPAGQLTAAEWRDLDHWNFWLNLFEPPTEEDDPSAEDESTEENSVGEIESVHESWRTLESEWQTCTRARYPVEVSFEGAPVVDVGLELYGNGGEEPLWRGRTDAAGRGDLFAGYVGEDCASEEASPTASSLLVRGSGGDVLWEGTPLLGDEPLFVTIESLQPADYILDLMFLVDTTGSMSDELRYLSAEIDDVIDRVRDGADANLEIRVSLGFYRDVGDEYVVQMFEFTTDIDQALSTLSMQTADGGGDYPEAVHSALAEAVHEQSWSESATARLLFLVLDAPPHDDADVKEQLSTSIPAAAAKGIRIIPLASSGYDELTEYLTRAWAIATGGTFLFLTDDSGIGNSHREPTIGDHQVELLNNLLVRVVTDYLDAN